MFTVITALVLQSLTLSASVPVSWHPYNNGRYGFTSCHPTSMHSTGESDNSDGIVYTDSHNASISAWGENNYQNTSLSSHVNATHNKGEIVTYQVNKPNWVVQSGTVGNQIFWRKTYIQGDNFVTLMMKYPVQYKQSYDPFVKTVNACFKTGTPAY